jgi:uncharacterized membrane protein YtjA (UPF0391 family)
MAVEDVPRQMLCRDVHQSRRGILMLYYALVFLLVGLVAGVLGVTGVAAIATQISWILFVIGIVLLLVHIVKGQAPHVN